MNEEEEMTKIKFFYSNGGNGTLCQVWDTQTNEILYDLDSVSNVGDDDKISDLYDSFLEWEEAEMPLFGDFTIHQIQAYVGVDGYEFTSCPKCGNEEAVYEDMGDEFDYNRVHCPKCGIMEVCPSCADLHALSECPHTYGAWVDEQEREDKETFARLVADSKKRARTKNIKHA